MPTHLLAGAAPLLPACFSRRRRAIVPVPAEPALSRSGGGDPRSGLCKIPDLFLDLEQVATGMRWAEGPAYFPEGGYLLFSDIPNNRIMKFDEKTNQPGVPRQRQLRQRQRARPSGPARHLRSIRSPAASPAPRRTARSRCWPDKFEGKRLNAPNDTW